MAPPSRSCLQLFPQVGPVLRVKAGRRLVKEQHPRPVHDAERDLEPAALTAGVGADGPVGEAAVTQPEHLEQLRAAPAGAGGAEPVQAAGEQQVLPPGRVLVGAPELADVTDPPPDQRRLAPHVRPGDRASPASAGSSVVRMRRVVVLPAPFGPSRPKISPGATARSIPVSAAIGAPLTWKVLRSPVTWIAAAAVSVMQSPRLLSIDHSVPSIWR